MKFVLNGSVVTMNAAYDVWPDGAVYIDGNQIVSAGDRRRRRPRGSPEPRSSRRAGSFSRG